MKKWITTGALTALAACAAQVDGVESSEGAEPQFASAALLAEAPVDCPLISEWPTLPDGTQLSWSDEEYAAIHEYDPCFATTKNWDRVSEDFIIESPRIRGISPRKGLEVTMSQSLAGGIASVKWLGQEFVASGGHGSAFGYNIVSASQGECYNPTEFGSKLDDCKDLEGNYALDWDAATGFRCASFSPGQFHGPSTSAFYPDHAWSDTHPYAFRSSSRLAHYVPQGWKGFGDCSADYASGIESGYGLSHFNLHKTFAVGIVRKAENGTCSGPVVSRYPVMMLDNKITTDGSFPIWESDPTQTMDQRFALYLPRDFSRIESMSGDVRFLGEVTDDGMTDFGAASERTDPLIYATRNGRHAVGFYAHQPGSARGTMDAPYYWAEHSDGNAGFEQRMLQVTSRGNGNWSENGSGVYGENRYTHFAVFGQIQRVRRVLEQLTTECADNGCCVSTEEEGAGDW